MALTKRVVRQNNLSKNPYGNNPHQHQNPIGWMCDFTNSKNGDLGTGAVEYSGTYSYLNSGQSGPCGTINALTGGSYLVGKNTDSSGYNIITSGHFGYPPDGGNSDFLTGPPWPIQYPGPFTSCIAFYVPLSGTGAWTQANNTYVLWETDMSPNTEDNYNGEVCIDAVITTAGGAQVGIYHSYGGDETGMATWLISYVTAGPIANITSSGWYMITTTSFRSGNMTTDSWITIESLYNSSNGLMGYIAIPGGAQGPSYSATNPTWDACPMPSDSTPAPASTTLHGPNYGGFFAYWPTGLGASAGFEANGNVCIDHYGWYEGFPQPTMRPIIQNKQYNISAPHGQSWSMQVIATNNPTSFKGYFKAAFSGLISCNTATGVVSGTTPAAGTYQFVVACGNPWGTDAKRFQLTVT